MGCTVRLRELPSVTILNQIEVKVNELLVVLFGNPLVDAVKSGETIKMRKYFVSVAPSNRGSTPWWLCSSPLCIARPKPERGEAINIAGQLFKVSTVRVADTDAYR